MDAFKQGVPGMLSAGGEMLAGFVDDARTKAILMAVMETAAGIGDMALGNYLGGGLHFASAAQYGVAAALAGGSPPSGGGGGGGAASGGSTAAENRKLFGLTPPAADSGPVTINLQFDGATVFGNKEDVYRDIAGGIDRHITRYRGAGKKTRFGS